MASPLLAPYAILPCIRETSNGVDFKDNTSSVDRSIFHVSENKFYERKNMFKDYAGAWCVGSSHGWLVLLDTKGSPFLLNPSTFTCIYLPPFSHTFMLGARVNHSYYIEFLRKTFVFKAVLMCSPSPFQYKLVIMYDYPCKLAFCTDQSPWVEFSDAERYYCDIVSLNNHLYALGGDGSIQEWNFCGQRPIKTLDVKPNVDVDDEQEEERKFPRDKYSWQIYFVISRGEYLLVKRYIGDFVNVDGEVVYEGYESSSGDGQICSYRTKCFVVYKLDTRRNKWVKKDYLHDLVIFVGANESTSVAAHTIKGCEPNSIYFTDDRWEEMSLDYSYGGHDWGVFSLQDKSVKLLAPRTNKMDPPPVWMIPTSFIANC